MARHETPVLFARDARQGAAQGRASGGIRPGALCQVLLACRKAAKASAKAGCAEHGQPLAHGEVTWRPSSSLSALDASAHGTPRPSILAGCHLLMECRKVSPFTVRPSGSARHAHSHAISVLWSMCAACATGCGKEKKLAVAVPNEPPRNVTSKRPGNTRLSPRSLAYQIEICLTRTTHARPLERRRTSDGAAKSGAAHAHARRGVPSRAAWTATGGVTRMCRDADRRLGRAAFLRAAIAPARSPLRAA